MQRQGGFTLLELLIVAAIMGVASIYMFETVTAGNRTYTVLEQVTDSQQSVRVIADLMERDVRHAGFMVPQGAGICGVDNTASPDVFFVSDADAIDPGNDVARYEGPRLTGGVTNVSGTTVTVGLTSLIVEPSPPTRAAYDTNGDGTNDSDFRVGGGVIVMDVNDPGRGTVCGTIKTIALAGTTITIDPVATAALSGPTGATRLVAVPAHEYRIANGDKLYRDGLLIAHGVEDLQLAYFFDANGNAQVDAGEMRGTTAGTDDYSAQATDASDLAEVRLNLVVRTRAEDDGFTGKPQAMENRAAGADDGFRRRVYVSTVMPRNMLSRLGT